MMIFAVLKCQGNDEPSYVRLPKGGRARPPLRIGGPGFHKDVKQCRKWAPMIVAALGSSAIAALGSLMTPAWNCGARIPSPTEQTGSIAQEATGFFTPAALQLSAHGKERLRIPSSAFRAQNTGCLFTNKEYRQVTNILAELNIDVTPDSAFFNAPSSDINARAQRLAPNDWSSVFSRHSKPRSNNSSSGSSGAGSPSESALWPGAAPRRPFSANTANQDNLGMDSAQLLHNALWGLEKRLQHTTVKYNGFPALSPAELKSIATSFHIRCLAPIIVRQILAALTPERAKQFSGRIHGALNQVHALAHSWPFPFPSSAQSVENEIMAPQFPYAPSQMRSGQLLNSLYAVTDHLYRSEHLLTSMLETLQRRIGVEGAVRIAQTIRDALTTDVEQYQQALSCYAQQCNVHQLCALLETDSERWKSPLATCVRAASHSGVFASNTPSPPYNRHVETESSRHRSDPRTTRAHSTSVEASTFPTIGLPVKAVDTIEKPYRIRGPRTVYNIVEGLADLTCSLVILDLLRFRKNAHKVAEDEQRYLFQSARTNLWPIAGGLKPESPTAKRFQDTVMGSSYADKRLTGLYSRYSSASEALSETQLVERFRRLNEGLQMGLKTIVSHKLLCDRICMCISRCTDGSVRQASERIQQYGQELEMTCRFLHKKLNEFIVTAAKRVNVGALHRPLAELWHHTQRSAQLLTPGINTPRRAYARIPALSQTGSAFSKIYRAPEKSNTSGLLLSPTLPAVTQLAPTNYGASSRAAAGAPSDSNVAYVSVIRYAHQEQCAEPNVAQKTSAPELTSAELHKTDKTFLGAKGKAEGSRDPPYVSPSLAGCSYIPLPGPSYSNTVNPARAALHPEAIPSISHPHQPNIATLTSGTGSATEGFLERSNATVISRSRKTWKRQQKKKRSNPRIP